MQASLITYGIIIMKSGRENTQTSQVRERTFYDINLKDEVESYVQCQKSNVTSRRHEATQMALSAAAALLEDEDTQQKERSAEKSLIDIESESKYITALNSRQVTALESSKSQKDYMKACHRLKLRPREIIFAGLARASLLIGNHLSRDTEVLALSFGLLENFALTELHLVNNSLTAKSIMFLSAALWENSYIKKVRLVGNKFSDKSVSELAELFSNTGVTDVDLSGKRLLIPYYCLYAVFTVFRCLELNYMLLDNKIEDRHGILIGNLIKVR